MGTTRRSSPFRRALVAVARALTRPRPYTLRWQLARALAKVDRLERENRELREGRAEDARTAANHVLEAVGVNPIFTGAEPPEPPNDDAPVLTMQARAERINAWRAEARKRFADLMGYEYQQVLHLEREFVFMVPEWNIFDPAWWATRAPELAANRKAREEEGAGERKPN